MLRERGLFGRSTRTFTLQWHLTNRCDSRCLHCYDRGNRAELPLAACHAILDDLLAFCSRRRVKPHVSLSGGNPLLYPGFLDIWSRLQRDGLRATILGNPIPRETIAQILRIGRPAYYQVSLEGLQEHNDTIRGAGHFARTLAFLRDARDEGLTTHVMLTLTNANIGQVIPLGRALEGLAHRFTYNRLARVGEGRRLELPSREAYAGFLAEYLAAAREMPILGMKENLLNLLRDGSGAPRLGGCTGNGCGAAFNFVALLPDGEVHACRKFPSPIGCIQTQTLQSIYRSKAAQAYRRGPAACSGCRVKRACRGCMAVTSGEGLDPLTARDPHCWAEHRAG